MPAYQVDELLAVLDAEFGEEAIEVSFYRPHRDNQSVGDLTVGQTGHDQHRNLALAAAER